jgi:hypothetical protein
MKAMQERPPYKITADEGWSQMRPILDKAMPVERRSRRILFFWLTAATGIIALSISVFLLSGKSRNIENNPVVVPSTGIAATAPRSSAQQESIDDHSGNENELPVTISSTQKINSQKNNAGKIKVSSSKDHQSNFNEPVIAVEDHKSMANDQTANLNLSPVSTSTEVVMHTQETNLMQRSDDVVNFLPLAALEYKDEMQVNMDPISPAIIKTNLHHLLRPFVSVAGMAGSQHGLGWEGLVGVAYDILPELSLTANIGYSAYRLNALNPGHVLDYNQDAEAIANLDADPSYILGEKLNASTDYTAINPFIHSIQHWQADAGFLYKISRKFLFEGGVGIGFGITTKSEYPIVTYGSYVSSLDANIAKSFDNYNLIRPIMTSLYGGFGYRVTRHLSIDAKWSHGLDHYILNEQVSYNSNPQVAYTKRSDYIRGFKVGLQYQL